MRGRGVGGRGVGGLVVRFWVEEEEEDLPAYGAWGEEEETLPAYDEVVVREPGERGAGE